MSSERNFHLETLSDELIGCPTKPKHSDLSKNRSMIVSSSSRSAKFGIKSLIIPTTRHSNTLKMVLNAPLEVLNFLWINQKQAEMSDSESSIHPWTSFVKRIIQEADITP
jgi:hypothetical protein